MLLYEAEIFGLRVKMEFFNSIPRKETLALIEKVMT